MPVARVDALKKKHAHDHQRNLRHEPIQQHESDGRSLISGCCFGARDMRDACRVDKVPCTCICLDREGDQTNEVGQTRASSLRGRQDAAGRNRACQRVDPFGGSGGVSAIGSARWWGSGARPPANEGARGVLASTRQACMHARLTRTDMLLLLHARPLRPSRVHPACKYSPFVCPKKPLWNPRVFALGVEPPHQPRQSVAWLPRRGAQTTCRSPARH